MKFLIKAVVVLLVLGATLMVVMFGNKFAGTTDYRNLYTAIPCALFVLFLRWIIKYDPVKPQQ